MKDINDGKKEKIGKLHKKNVSIKKEDNSPSKMGQFNFVEVIIIMILTTILGLMIGLFSSKLKDSNNKKNPENELVSTYAQIIEEYYEDINKDELAEAGIKGMLEYLGDPYTTYLDLKETSELNLAVEGEYVGMGGEISLNSEGKVYIHNLFANSPGEKAGLKVNDIIYEIDGTIIENMSLSSTSAIILTNAKKEIPITVIRDKEKIELILKTGTVELDSVATKIITHNNQKIALMTVSVFAKNTTSQFLTQYNEVKDEVDGIIVDLRNNSGGYLTTAASMSALFLDKGDIIYQLNTKNNIEKIYDEDEKTINTKVAILINNGSASASEIFTAALKENLNVPVIGVTSYGKGSVQKLVTLSSGASIKYTIQKWLTPKGNTIEGVGIAPTKEIKYFYDKSNKSDNQLQAALDEITK